MNGSGQLDQVELHGLLRQGRKVSLAQNLQAGFHGAMPELSKGAEGEIELEAKLKGAAIRKAANERGARFTEAFGEIKVAEVPAKLKEMLDQRHERLRDVFNEWDLDRDGNLDRHEFAVGLAAGARARRRRRPLALWRLRHAKHSARSARSSPSSSAARSGTRRRAAGEARPRAAGSADAAALVAATRGRRGGGGAFSSSSSSSGGVLDAAALAARCPPPAARWWRAGETPRNRSLGKRRRATSRRVSARALPLNRLGQPVAAAR